MNFRFKDIREDHDLRQHQIARKLHISRSTYASIEAETDNVKLKTLNLFCNEFSYSMDYVYNLTDKLFYSSINKISKLEKEVIAKRLKIIEKELHKTAKELALELGIAPSTYSGYKRVYRQELIQTLMVKYLAQTYNYSMDWIAGRSDQKYIKK